MECNSGGYRYQNQVSILFDTRYQNQNWVSILFDTWYQNQIWVSILFDTWYRNQNIVLIPLSIPILDTIKSFVLVIFETFDD